MFFNLENVFVSVGKIEGKIEGNILKKCFKVFLFGDFL